MNKTEKITFRLDDQLKKQLAHFAELKGISTGKLIRNCIDVIINNPVSNSTIHSYQLDDKRQFPNMKALCNELKISSHTARKRIKNGVIKKITIDPNQANKYGNELQTARSGETEKPRIEF